MQALTGSFFLLASLWASPWLLAQSELPPRSLDWRIWTPWQTFDPLAGEPIVPATLPTPTSSTLKIVQFRSQILPEYRQAIERLRIEIYNYLPEQGYLVRTDAAREARLAALPFVRWIGDWKVAYRLDGAIVDDLMASRELPTKRLVLVLFDRYRDRAPLVDLIERVGGSVARLEPESPLLEANLSGAQMLQVAASNLVVWIQRWGQPGTDMDNVRAVCGANYIETVAGYTGKGVRGHFMEGIQQDHPEFAATPYRTAPIGIWNVISDQHGCATFGEVFSKGLFPQARGLLPDGQGLFTNASYITSQGTDAGSRYQVFRDLSDPLKPYRAMQQTAAWGDPPNVVYDAASVAMDLGIFTFDLPTTQSQSNTGSQSSRPQAWAKNVIAVGGHYHADTQSFADDRWGNGGSTGPAPDGRIKPDLCGFYDLVCTTWTSSSYGTNFGGTSAATAMCNGMLGLAQELFTDGIFGHVFAQGGWQQRFKNRPHFTTMKALLINTARQYDPALNLGTARSNQGWGFPRLDTIWDERDRILLLDEADTLQQGQTRGYFVWAPGGKTLRATLVYSDPPGTPNVNPNRVNDLNLKVTGASGTSWWGNNGLATGLHSTSGGAPNTLDTVENVFLASAPMGWYRIDVSASLVAQDAHRETTALDADFALAVSGIQGLRDIAKTRLSLTASVPGEFKVSVTGLPASWVDGFTVFSATTPRAVGFGNFFGIELDALSLSSLQSPGAPGNPFHFKPTASMVYPNAAYAFWPPLATVMAGMTFDAVVFTVDAGGRINAMSNVARVALPRVWS